MKKKTITTQLETLAKRLDKEAWLIEQQNLRWTNAAISNSVQSIRQQANQLRALAKGIALRHRVARAARSVFPSYLLRPHARRPMLPTVRH